MSSVYLWILTDDNEYCIESKEQASVHVVSKKPKWGRRPRKESRVASCCTD